MRFDIALPIESISYGKSRDEIFIVYFDGFIKNISEGILKILLEDYSIYNQIYPGLEYFYGMTDDEIYENSLLFHPKELLTVLSDNTLSDDDLDSHYNELREKIQYQRLNITSFEFCLYQLLKEDFVKKCFFYKDDEFTQNEISYLKIQFGDSFEKIAFATGSIVNLFEDENPTTIFTSDEHIIDVFVERYNDEMLQNKLFIILNNSHFIDYNEQTKQFEYQEDFLKKLNELNEKQIFGITPTYNFQLNTDDVGNSNNL